MNDSDKDDVSAASVASFSVSAKTRLPVGIVTFHLDSTLNTKKYVRCEICSKYPNIVKRYCGTHHPPRITTSEGTRFLNQIVDDHVKSQYHAECTKAHRLETLKSGEIENAPMDIFINKANKRLMDYVGKLMIQVFHDAKRLTLSAYSWPSRFVTGEASSAYDSEKQPCNIIAENIRLQYVNPTGHFELINSIVNSHRSGFMRKINNCLLPGDFASN